MLAVAGGITESWPAYPGAGALSTESSGRGCGSDRRVCALIWRSSAACAIGWRLRENVSSGCVLGRSGFALAGTAMNCLIVIASIRCGAACRELATVKGSRSAPLAVGSIAPGSGAWAAMGRAWTLLDQALIRAPAWWCFLHLLWTPVWWMRSKRWPQAGAPPSPPCCLVRCRQSWVPGRWRGSLGGRYLRLHRPQVVLRSRGPWGVWPCRERILSASDRRWGDVAAWQ